MSDNNGWFKITNLDYGQSVIRFFVKGVESGGNARLKDYLPEHYSVVGPMLVFTPDELEKFLGMYLDIRIASLINEQEEKDRKYAKERVVSDHTK